MIPRARRVGWVLCLLICSCSSNDRTRQKGSQTYTAKAINKVYSDFELAVKDKNTALLKSTFLSEKTQLNAYIRTPSGLRLNIFPLKVWTDFLGKITDPYHIEISNIEIESSDNIAYSVADFTEFYLGDSISAGKDLFVYINTSSGWKIVSLSNTATVFPKDSIILDNFPAGNPTSAKKVVDELFRAINQKDTTTIGSLIKKPAPFLSLKIDADSSKNVFTLNSLDLFAKEIEALEGITNVEHLNTRAIDRNLLISELRAEIREAGEITSVMLYVTLFADDVNEWFVTSLVGQQE